MSHKPAAAAGKKAAKPQQQQPRPSGAGAAAALAKAKRPAPTRRARAQEDEESSSSGESDSDDEIGLSAGQHVRATVTPIRDDAPAAGAAAAKPAPGKKRKANPQAQAEAEAEAGAESDDGSDAPEGGPDSELIDVEFGIYDTKPMDYMTMKMMLRDFVHPSSHGKKAKGKKKKAAAAAATAAQPDSDDDGDAGDEADADATSRSSSADADFALHELCAALSTQAGVGSTIKGEGTDEPLGFISALNLHWQEQNARNEQDGKPVVWVSQLRKYLLRHTPAQHKAALDAAMREPATGLLIQSRLLNAPPQMVPPLHQCLMDDIAWAQQNALPPPVEGASAAATAAASTPQAIAAYRRSFAFKQYLFVGRTFKPLAGSKRSARQEVMTDAGPGAQNFVSPFASKKKQKKAAAAGASVPASGAAGLPEYEWLRFEEELYAQAASLHFSVPCPFTEEDAAAGRVAQRCEVMLLSAAKLPAIVQQLQAMAAMS